ncbi:MAG TPA: hypothetical protein VKV15_15530 [Bryobacteraceae bacterium]|nr:hypothetical protein [Bryobacteraceae bacterium]
MNWTRTDTLALASHNCTHCHGLGLRLGKKSATTPCGCVRRAIFRLCYERFEQCVTREKHMSRVTLEANAGRERKNTWGRKDEEYVADFTLITKRALDELEHKIFRYHYLLGADWNLCCRKLGMDRGTFFHTVYRIQQKLGRAFRETEPYGLFPLDEYFNGTSKADQFFGKTGQTVSIREVPANLRFPVPGKPKRGKPATFLPDTIAA